jgi:putative glutamine amidotransferase
VSSSSASRTTSSKAPRRPIVGIPACIKMLGVHPFHAVGQKYVDAVLHGAGATPLLLPAIGEAQDIDQLLDLVDGILLTGSVSNVAPERYGSTLAHPDLPTDLQRDATTLPLIEAALARGIPLLGICRGFQELNVACGGSLHQEVHAQPGKHDHRADDSADVNVQYGPAHAVSLTPGGVLQGLLGGAQQVTVNSIHGQGIAQLGKGLAVEATAPDGLVEAIRVADAPAFAMAVQWHPEWKLHDNPDSQRIFAAFGQACLARSLQRLKHD